MTKTLLPRVLASLAAAVITLSLFDAVATMGQDPGAVATAPARPATTDTTLA